MTDVGNSATYGAICAAPTVSMLTLLSGRHPNLATELKTAVDKLVEANPFLSGRMIKKEGRILVEPGAHSECFFRVVEPPKEPPEISSLDLKQRLEFLQTLEPLFTPPGTALVTLRTGCLIFLVELMTFPNHVCFVLHLSHLVGDAKTCYDLVKQLNLLLRGEKVSPLEWESPKRNDFELLPLSLKDREKVSNFGFVGWLAQAICGPKRVNHVILLSKSHIEKEKQAQKKQAEFLSSNDVITAALAKSIRNSYVMNIAVNMRGRENIPENAAGNFWHSVPMDHQAASDPNEIRAHLPKLQYYKDDEIPRWPFFRGRYSFVTNWTSFTCHLEVEGLKVECHAVHGNFLRANPTNVAVVFHAAPDSIALSHNVPDYNFDPTGLGALT